MAEKVRLNKHLAHTLGISRREADIQIELSKVRVNGEVATLGNTVNLDVDKIAIDGRPISTNTKNYTYILMNKPVGYICSRKRQGQTPTIYNLLPKELHYLKVAGRLDKDSCGLILLTDDGDTIFKLTHPKFGKQKIYYVGLNKVLTPEDLAHIEKGVDLEDGASKFQVEPIELKVPETEEIMPNTYKVTMSEGRNRQIRRTFGGLRYMVTHLERQSFGPYKIEQLNGETYLQI